MRGLGGLRRNFLTALGQVRSRGQKGPSACAMYDNEDIARVLNEGRE